MAETMQQVSSPDLATAFSVADPWRRAIAGCIDLVLIILMSFLIMFLLMPLSPHPLLIAAASGLAGLLYYSVLQTRVADGQTVGKAVLNIRVSDRDGGYLSFKKSLLRAVVFYSPSAGEAFLSATPFKPAAAGLGFALTVFDTYLLFWDKPGRRLLHDRLAGSWVIKTKTVAVLPNASPLTPRQRLALAGVVAGCLTISIVMQVVEAMLKARG